MSEKQNKIKVKINELRKNVVLSRKELLETDIREKRQDIISQLEVGMVLEGIVKNITDFGAFIDLGGIDGLLHITDITWGRINHPSEVLELDKTVTVKVIDFDVEKVMSITISGGNGSGSVLKPVVTKRQRELLENGAKSLSQSWLLGAMYN